MLEYLNSGVVNNDTVRGCECIPIVTSLPHTVIVNYGGNLTNPFGKLKRKALTARSLVHNSAQVMR
jgi:hypothetical protein